MTHGCFCQVIKKKEKPQTKNSLSDTLEASERTERLPPQLQIPSLRALCHECGPTSLKASTKKEGGQLGGSPTSSLLGACCPQWA